jgi:hypothetical protein
VWSWPLTDGVAVALYDKNSTASLQIRSTMALVGYSSATRVRVRDLFAHKENDIFVGGYTAAVVPLHAVRMLWLGPADQPGTRYVAPSSVHI